MSEQPKDLCVKYEIDGEEITLSMSMIQNYIVAGGGDITVGEFKMFTELCKARKLNPFLKEAYCIKYGTMPAQIVVGKDAIVKRAVTHKQYNGMESGIFVLDENNTLTERKGTFKLPTEKLVGGWARVYRKNWDYPQYMSVTLDEVVQRKKDGSVNSQWSEKPATMVEKVAKVRALREAFVEDLGGMIDEDEAWTENNSTDPPIIIPQDEPQETEPPTDEPIEVDFNEI